MLTIGSLFSGYGGLDMAAEHVFGARTAWASDIDKGACKVLAHRYPDVPNLGDITTIDWATVEPVDIITGGSPCQDLSTAGRRAGMTDGTRSNLWVAMREAIAHVQPTYVIWENVRGALSAAAASGMESDPRLLGDHPAGQPVLRALGRVLGDLADLGFDAEWRGIRASDVGACHQRFRVFVLAWRRDLADGDIPRLEGQHGHAEQGAGRSDLTLLPTPEGADASGGRVSSELGGKRPSGAKRAVTLSTAIHHLLPTPRTSDTNGAGVHGTGGPDLRTVAAETLAMLPTPKAGDADFGLPRTSGRPPEKAGFLATRLHYTSFSQYAPAVARQVAAFGYPAPSPTEPGKNRPRLSARFAEWMMGLPAGWITDAPDVTRNEALRMAGNGVVPQQAAAALADMWQAMHQEVAA